MQVNVCYLSMIHNVTLINLDIDSSCRIKVKGQGEVRALVHLHVFGFDKTSRQKT